MTKPDAFPPFAATVEVPFPRISTFVRQLTHDVRNSLNAMDLQAAYVLELVEDPEASEEIKRLREQIQESAKALQSLSAHFWQGQPSLVNYSAGIFVEDFRDRLVKKHPDEAPSVTWSLELGEETISIDIEMIFNALLEVLKNAFQFSQPGEKIAVRAFAEADRFVLEVKQKLGAAVSPEKWGTEPFVTTRRGAYGLGLFRSRMLLAAHGGELHYSYDSGCTLLTARISLPLAA